jgi:hypothetical protein
MHVLAHHRCPIVFHCSVSIYLFYFTVLFFAKTRKFVNPPLRTQLSAIATRPFSSQPASSASRCACTFSTPSPHFFLALVFCFLGGFSLCDIVYLLSPHAVRFLVCFRQTTSLALFSHFLACFFGLDLLPSSVPFLLFSRKR